VLTGERWLLKFCLGRPAAEMPIRYMAGIPLTKLNISIIKKIAYFCIQMDTMIK